MFKNAFYIALFAFISWGSYQISFPSDTPPNLFHEGIFMENIIEHVDKITQGPRAVGDYFHDDVQRYLISQLNTMGWRVSKQKSIAFNSRNRTAAPIRNIIAKRTGSHPDSQDLLIMAHYDAAKFTGTGAGDDASGLAAILETVNAFYKTKKTHKNDIIVLFTDAEEIGLLGAHAFINEQLKHHDIGMIINLEARGSGGPVMMWPETTGGNKAMIEGFSAADVPFPVTTSLHYEIYKMLPNNTDLSPFNQLGKINGFNLAFIDDHFNYHTRRDTLENLSLNTLAHQAIQLQSMLNYFADADLSQMHSDDSLVYTSLPIVGLVSYPVWLTWFLMVVFGLLFILQIFSLRRLEQASFKDLINASLPIISASVFAYFWCWLILFIVYSLFPEFKDILQGFPYLGHHLMAALLISAAIIAMSVFGWFNRDSQAKQGNQTVLNIGLWYALLLPLIYFMPGSGFLIWPVLFSIILLTVHIRFTKIAEQLAPIFAVLSFILLGALLINLPIALGVNALPIIAVILVWIFGLFMPIITPIKKINRMFILLILPSGYLTYELFKAPTISAAYPHPTSLSYLYDSDTQQGYFYNYDVAQSGWTEHLFKSPEKSQDTDKFRKSYKQPVKNLVLTKPAIPLQNITIKAKKPLQQRSNKTIDIDIIANNNTELIEIYTRKDLTIHKLTIDERIMVFKEPIDLKSGQRLLRYYFNGKKQIKLRLETGLSDSLDWQVQSHGLDLLARPEFAIPGRPAHQIPKPFIKSDNTVVIQSFAF